MAEQSPSGSSSEISRLSGPSSGSDDGAFVVCAKQPPFHLFPYEWCDVHVTIDHPRAAAETTIVLRTVLYEMTEDNRPFDSHVTGHELTLDTDPAEIRFPPPSRITSSQRVKRSIKFRMKVGVMMHLRSDRKALYCIRLFPQVQHGSPLRGVEPIFTTGFQLVNSKLEITTEDDEWPQCWYKDEGGREKGITVTAGLYDKDHGLVTGRRVPLKLTLLYDNDNRPIKVMRQSFLKLLGTTRPQIDPTTGTTTIKFRIDDVSKNHQGQGFCVEVAPDANAKGATKDIGPGTTPPVSVRSKRNKRQRTSSGVRSENMSPSREMMQTASHNMAAPFDMPDSTREGLAGVDDVVRLKDAMGGLVQWTREVVNGLYPLQWQLLGYEREPDGSVDYNRPYYSMPNPNATISRILNMYSESTRENIRVVMTAVEQTRRTGEGDVPDLDLGQPSTTDSPYQNAGRYASPFVHPDGHVMQQTAQHMAYAHPQQPFTQEHYAAVAKPAEAIAAQFHGSDLGTMQRAPMASPQIGGQVPHFMPSAPQVRELGVARMDTGRREPRSDPHFADTTREGEVEYVLAKQYKAMRTGERLGFPAYSSLKEILGFYRESSVKVGVGRFVPISLHRDEFGPREKMQATRILEEAMVKTRDAVYELNKWGTISNLLDHALVFDWSKDVPNAATAGSAASGGSE